jgi:hypothetical protein
MARHRRQGPRVDVRQSAVLINSDGAEFQVVVLDISSAGCRIEVEEAPRAGERVLIRDDRGYEYEAEIRWTLGTQAGARFLTSANL